jgi:hypothetical protein
MVMLRDIKKKLESFYKLKDFLSVEIINGMMNIYFIINYKILAHSNKYYIYNIKNYLCIIYMKYIC